MELKFGNFLVSSDNSLHELFSSTRVFKQGIERPELSNFNVTRSGRAAVFQPKMWWPVVSEDKGFPLHVTWLLKVCFSSRFGPKISHVIS